MTCARGPSFAALPHRTFAHVPSEAGLQEAVLWHAHDARAPGVAGYAGECLRAPVDVYDEYAGERVLPPLLPFALPLPRRARSPTLTTCLVHLQLAGAGAWLSLGSAGEHGARPTLRSGRLTARRRPCASWMVTSRVVSTCGPPSLIRSGAASTARRRSGSSATRCVRPSRSTIPCTQRAQLTERLLPARIPHCRLRCPQFVHVIDHQKQRELFKQFSVAPHFFASLPWGAMSFCPEQDWAGTCALHHSPSPPPPPFRSPHHPPFAALHSLCAVMPRCIGFPCHGELWEQVGPGHDQLALSNFWTAREDGVAYLEPAVLRSSALSRTPVTARVWELELRGKGLRTVYEERNVLPSQRRTKFTVVAGKEGEASGSGSLLPQLRSRFIDMCLERRLDCFGTSPQTQEWASAPEGGLEWIKMEATLDRFFSVATRVWPPVPDFALLASLSKKRREGHMLALVAVSALSGLGNRLRSLASAAVMARATGRQLFVHWQPSANFNGKFDDLFQPRCKGAGTEGWGPQTQSEPLQHEPGSRVLPRAADTRWASSLNLASLAEPWLNGVGTTSGEFEHHGFGEHAASVLPDAGHIATSSVPVISVATSSDYRHPGIDCRAFLSAKAAFYRSALSPLSADAERLVEQGKCLPSTAAAAAQLAPQSSPATP